MELDKFNRKHKKIDDFDKENEEFQLDLDNLLEIIGNSTRRVILAKLAKVPHSASELAHSLGISRQAVHSQLKILEDKGVIENITIGRGGKYRIKNSISLRVDITPDYYNVKYNFSEINDDNVALNLRDMGFDTIYKKIKEPNEKIRFLAKKIQEIESKVANVETERTDLILNKECLIVELKKLMANQYESQLREKQRNTEKEIFFTLFYEPLKFFKRRINIDKLMDEMFFRDLDSIDRAQNKTVVHHLLKDLSRFMDFLKEEDDDWFIDV